MSSYSRLQMERWLSQIDVNCEKVLDIGGSQLPIKNRVNSFNVDKYLIMDIQQPHECKQKPDIIFDINNKIRLNRNLDEKYINYFNEIFLLEVTEYLFNPVRAFKNCNILLKEGGLIHLSSHFIYPVHNPVSDDYLRYTPAGIKKILNVTGFEIISSRDRIEKEPEFLQGDGFGSTLMNWFRHQEMRPAKDYNKHNVVGSLITAIKTKDLYADELKD